MTGNDDEKMASSGKHEVDPLRMYWWDQKVNFGDLIGPWLVREITGRDVVNTMWEEVGEAPGLLTVGSLLHSLRRSGLDVWGAGSMRSLDEAFVKKLSVRQPRKIHAVRGWRTYQELTSKLGWQVPKVYGDPALLAPRFHSASQSDVTKGRISIVPHYFHKKYFDPLEGDRFHIVNVARDPTIVIDEIASSDVCMSTSLHGVIVAHAYQVPWVWVRVADHPLRGDRFKFEDFFTVLDRSKVGEVSLSVEDITAGFMTAHAKKAAVPANKFTFDDLLDAFPSELS